MIRYVAVELAADIRLRYPKTEVTILSRTGDVLLTAPVSIREKVHRVLEKMGIDVVKGSVDEDARTPHLNPGMVILYNSRLECMNFDV